MIEVDDNFDAPELMDEDMFNGDNGDVADNCNGGGSDQVKFQNKSKLCMNSYTAALIFVCIELIKCKSIMTRNILCTFTNHLHLNIVSSFI